MSVNLLEFEKQGFVQFCAELGEKPFRARQLMRWIHQSGVADFEAVSWHTLIARSGTPPEIINRLHEEMGRIMKAPEVRERIAGLGLIPIDSMTLNEIQQYYRSEADKWGTLVKKLGLEGSH